MGFHTFDRAGWDGGARGRSGSSVVFGKKWKGLQGKSLPIGPRVAVDGIKKVESSEPIRTWLK